MRVRLSTAARGDLREIRDRLLGAAGPDRAREAMARLRGAILAPGTFPRRGNVPPELAALGDARHRELHVPPWRIVYHLAEDGVVIDLVADARRDFRALLERRLLRP